MTQLNVYVPDDLAKYIKDQAKKKGKSLSAYIQKLIQKESKSSLWKKDFFTKIVGGWKGPFPEISREEPEERNEL